MRTRCAHRRDITHQIRAQRSRYTFKPRDMPSVRSKCTGMQNTMVLTFMTHAR